MKDLNINVDMGESYGRFKVGSDEALMPLIQSCNLACGFHGGDPGTIRKTIDLALENDVKIGAHPSYPDLAGFGRRSMKLAIDELEDLLLYQISAVKGLVELAGGQLHHIKPHGALNNDMMKSPDVLATVLKVTRQVGSELKTYVPFQPDLSLSNVLWEVFADRTYQPDFSLTPRVQAGSLITDRVIAQEHLTSIIADSKIKTDEGLLNVEFDTLCVHGDNPNAVEIVQLIHQLYERS